MSLAASPVQVLLFVDGSFFAPVVSHYRSLSDGGVRMSGASLVSWCRNEVDRRLGRNFASCVVGEARLFLPAEERSPDGQAMATCIDADFAEAGFVLQKAPPGSGTAGHQLALAVEILDQTLRRKPQVVVLVAGFGGLAPLVRKLTAAGIAVLLPLFDVPATDRSGSPRRMRTASVLADAATWTVALARLPEGCGRFDAGPREPSFSPLRSELRRETPPQPPEDEVAPPPGPLQGAVTEMRDKMGFLVEDWNGRKLFFHHTAVVEPSFSDIGPGDRLEYERGIDPRGRACAINVRRLAAADAPADDPQEAVRVSGSDEVTPLEPGEE